MHVINLIFRLKTNLTKNSSQDVETQLKSYKLKGELKDRFLTLTGRNTDNKSLGVNAILLEVIGDGKTMKGFSSRYSITSKEIKSHQIQWKRR